MKKIGSYFGEIFRVKMPDQKFMKELFDEIVGKLTKAYYTEPAKKYLNSLPVQSLVDKSIELYVGSQIVPRNQKVMNMLFEMARRKAQENKNARQKNLVDYYYAYIIKMEAVKTGNTKQYQKSSDQFMELAQKGDPLSSYATAKELYLLLETGEVGEWKDQELIQNSRRFFNDSICDKQFGGLYYLAEIEQKLMLDRSEINEEKSKLIRQMYVQSASMGYPKAYWKLAKIYKQQGNFTMFRRYLILASEAGVVQAQHNLGIQYLKGDFFPKSEVKAFSWFLHASAHNFIYSKYNLSLILKNGSSCGTIQPNPKAALLKLQEIHRSGQIDVEKQIKQLMNILQQDY